VDAFNALTAPRDHAGWLRGQLQVAQGSASLHGARASCGMPHAVIPLLVLVLHEVTDDSRCFLDAGPRGEKISRLLMAQRKPSDIS
jgi:hypothetical protein